MKLFKNKHKHQTQHKTIYILFDKENPSNVYIINSEDGVVYLNSTKEFGSTPDYILGEYLYNHGGTVTTEHEKIALIGQRSILKKTLIMLCISGDKTNFESKNGEFYASGAFRMMFSTTNTLENLLTGHGYKIKYVADTSKERIKLVGRAITKLHSVIVTNDQVDAKIMRFINIITLSTDKNFIANGFLYGFEDSVVIGTYDFSKTNVQKYTRMIHSIETTVNSYLVIGKIRFEDNKIIYSL